MQCMRGYLLFISALLEVAGAQVVGPSEFWTRAQHTLKLSELRVGVPAKPPTVDDKAISLPNFLPLCGNGRVDTKEDYTAYYLNKSHSPLTLTRQQILYMYKDLQDPATLHNVSFFADEECDDGNRIDFDGCSADCMYMDLWTSACEMAVDLGPQTPTLDKLEYEDIIYDTTRKCMVVSAKSGIYALEVGLGSTALTALLLAPKSLPITNIFRHLDSLVLYSAEQQAFWRLADGDSAITLYWRLNLFKWNSTNLIWNCHQSPDGSVVVYDYEKMLYLATPTAEPFVCKTGRNRRCVFLMNIYGNSMFNCDTVRVIIGPGTCQLIPDGELGGSGSIWSHIFTKITWLTATVGYSNKQLYTISPELPSPDAGKAQQPVSLEVYHPMGGFMEFTVGSTRKLGSMGNSTEILYFTGTESLRKVIQDPYASCGSDTCIFDNDLAYDIFDSNPLRNAVKLNWNALLQQEILHEAGISPSLPDLAAIKADTVRYARLIDSFALAFTSAIQPLTVLGMTRHPITQNLWAVRKDRLIEVSKSGVLLQRADGRCIPSGVALCGSCQWAPNGHKCRPCSEADTTSWSWSMKCKACGRRLLAAGDASLTTITFVLAGSLESVQKVWPSAVYDPFTTLIKVTVVTSDSVGEMRQIQLKLLPMTDIQVVTRPYTVIRVGPDNSVSTIAFTLTGSFASVQSVWPDATQDAKTLLITVLVKTSDPVAKLQMIQLQLLSMTDVQAVNQPYIVILTVPEIGSEPSSDSTGLVTAAVLIPCLVVLAGVLIFASLHAGQRSVAEYRPVQQHPSLRP